jgi:hypothetical protein
MQNLLDGQNDRRTNQEDDEGASKSAENLPSFIDESGHSMFSVMKEFAQRVNPAGLPSRILGWPLVSHENLPSASACSGSILLVKTKGHYLF